MSESEKPVKPVLPPNLMRCWGKHLTPTAVEIFLTFYGMKKPLNEEELSIEIDVDEGFVAETIGWLFGLGLIRKSPKDNTRWEPITEVLNNPPTDEVLSRLPGDRNTPRASHARDPNRYAPTRPRVGECISFGDDSDNDVCIESGSYPKDDRKDAEEAESEQYIESGKSPDAPPTPPSEAKQPSDPGHRASAASANFNQSTEDPDHGKKRDLFVDFGISDTDAKRFGLYTEPLKKIEWRLAWARTKPGQTGFYIEMFKLGEERAPIPSEFHSPGLGLPPKAFNPEDVRMNEYGDIKPGTSWRTEEERQPGYKPTPDNWDPDADRGTWPDDPITTQQNRETIAYLMSKGMKYYRKTGSRTILGHLMGAPRLSDEEKEARKNAGPTANPLRGGGMEPMGRIIPKTQILKELQEKSGTPPSLPPPPPLDRASEALPPLGGLFADEEKSENE